MRRTTLSLILVTFLVLLALSACGSREQREVVTRDTTIVREREPGPPPAEMTVPQPPPPPREEVVGVPPTSGQVWVPGSWTWNNGWVWTPGHWESPPPRTTAWIPGQWVQRGQGWVWHPGQWR
jgi:hypothetical protein